MEMKIKSIIAITAAIMHICVYAQQIPTITQMRNVYDYNPATIGIHQNFSITSRQGFSGVEGAPALNIFSVNKLVDHNMGVGLIVYDYSQGFINQRGIKTGYAYRAKFSDNQFLAFGLSVDVFQYKYNQDLIKIKDPNDPIFTNQPAEQVAIDFDFGLSYNTPKFFFDIAIHQVPGRKFSLLNDFSESKKARHYFVHTGYKIPINDRFDLEPSVFGKIIEMGIFHSDIGLKGYFNDLFFLGAYYRTNQIIVGHTGFKLDRLSFGFAYEYGTGELFNYSTGNWEFQFIYAIHKTNRKLHTTPLIQF